MAARRPPFVSGAHTGAVPSPSPTSSGECSARGCRPGAIWALSWNNPQLHPPERRKIWLACEDAPGPAERATWAAAASCGRAADGRRTGSLYDGPARRSPPAGRRRRHAAGPATGTLRVPRACCASGPGCGRPAPRGRACGGVRAARPWQWHRDEAKEIRRDARVAANYDAAPVAAARVLPRAGSAAAGREQWPPVRVQRQLPCRPGPAGAQPAPVRADRLRGAGPAAAGRRRRAGGRPRLAAAGRHRPGPRTVAGAAGRPGRPSWSGCGPASPPGAGGPRPGRSRGRPRPVAAADWASRCTAVRRAGRGETARRRRRTDLLPRPDTDLGPHLSYFLQWFAFAVTALRDPRDARVPGGGEPHRATGAAAARSAPADPPTRRSRTGSPPVDGPADTGPPIRCVSVQ